MRVPGFNFIKHSLPAGRGRGSRACGGVGLYVKKGLKATPIIKSQHDVTIPIASRVENLAVQIKINDLNIAVAVLYNSGRVVPDIQPALRETSTGSP